MLQNASLELQRRYDMESFSVLLALSDRPVMQSFDVFFVASLKTRLKKQPSCRKRYATNVTSL